MKSISLRIILDLILIFSLFLFPWWVALILALIAVFFFDLFIEFVLISTLTAIIYFPDDKVWLTAFFAIIIFILLQFLKKRMIFYRDR